MVYTTNIVQVVVAVLVPLFLCGLTACGPDAPKMTTSEQTVHPRPGQVPSPLEDNRQELPNMGVVTVEPTAQPTPAESVPATQPPGRPTPTMFMPELGCEVNIGDKVATPCTHGERLDWIQWTPDGTAIVFHYAGRREPSALYAVTADGSSLRKLAQPSDTWVLPFDVSPDGTQIIYSRCTCQAGLYKFTLELLTLDADSSRTLEHNAADDYYAQWTPDGTQIAFVRDNELGLLTRVGTFLYVMSADGTDERIVYGSGNEVQSLRLPVWSPDGSKIAFISEEDRSPLANLYIVGSDGSDPRRLSSLYTLGPPSWSPDGERLAFFSVDADSNGGPRTDSPVSLYTIASDGTDLKRVFTNLAGHTKDFNSREFGQLKASWSPNGEDILFTCQYEAKCTLPSASESCRDEGMCIADLDGSVAVLSPLKVSAVWSPDGTNIAARVLNQFYEEDIIYVMDRDGSDVRVLVEKGEREGEIRAASGRVLEIGDGGVLYED